MTAVAISPEGVFFATGTWASSKGLEKAAFVRIVSLDDKAANITWDLDTPGRMTGKAKGLQEMSCEYGGNVGSLAFSPGRMGLLAIGGDANSAHKPVVLFGELKN